MNNLRKIFDEKGVIVKTNELYEAGYTRYDVERLLEGGIIERVKKGYYKLSGSNVSDIELVLSRVPNAVLCFDSALFYYGYSDRIPNEIHIAVDKDISKAKVRFDYPFVRPYFVEEFLLDIGVETVMIDGTKSRIYSRDRLICDCLKYERKMESEMFNKAIINYINDPKKNVSELMEYAKVRKVEKKVYDKIGMWL